MQLATDHCSRFGMDTMIRSFLVRIDAWLGHIWDPERMFRRGPETTTSSRTTVLASNTPASPCAPDDGLPIASVALDSSGASSMDASS